MAERSEEILKYEKIDSEKVKPPKDATVIVTKMGNTTELQYMSRGNKTIREKGRDTGRRC